MAKFEHPTLYGRFEDRFFCSPDGSKMVRDSMPALGLYYDPHAFQKASTYSATNLRQQFTKRRRWIVSNCFRYRFKWIDPLAFQSPEPSELDRLFS